MSKKDKLRIVFMGTPKFAVEPLRAVLQSDYHVVSVVTAPDRPAGRGQKISQSAVKEFAVENNQKVLQPTNLKDSSFVNELEALNADVFIVVAFRMLPKTVWSIPRFGTFNLHASLLPNYRGAAPINWAIINGEKTTGLTTFLIDEKIDTGRILLRTELDILPNETAGQLHDRMMPVGAQLVVDTLKMIESATLTTIPQDSLVGDFQKLSAAPKLFKETTRINWEKPAKQIHDFIRGLSPYPAAWTELVSANGQRTPVKVFQSVISDHKPKQHSSGSIVTDGKTFIDIACLDGYVSINEVQLAGKRKLKTKDFLLGFKDITNYSMG